MRLVICVRTWDAWFANALPMSTEEHIAFAGSASDESNPLGENFYFYIPGRLRLISFIRQGLLPSRTACVGGFIIKIHLPFSP